MIASSAAIALALLDEAHRKRFLSEVLPQSLMSWLPVIYIGCFFVALYLIKAKYPLLTIYGIFVPEGAKGHQNNGLFVANVGEATALNFKVERMGALNHDVSFDPVQVVYVGDREQVAMHYGSGVRDIFGVSSFLLMKDVVRGVGQKVDPPPHPIRFTYEDADGRKYKIEEFELRLINTASGAPIDLRLIVDRKRKKRQTIREWVGARLVRLAARILLRPPSGD
ncbi:MAG TPA: hypothetical protein VN380_05215 [Thermoanaerobaculia bacterium]|jgi:hypothetical protein|nr:hypothetical protein [Thermoanaerobaculia bacterium]